MSSVAVIDVGSNSIKVLVAAAAPDGGLTILRTRTLDARISAGISQAAPRLSAAGMAAGLDAIRTLLQDVAPPPVPCATRGTRRTSAPASSLRPGTGSESSAATRRPA
ncbi:MAG: hypothetical protein NT173_04000 [Opitutales bacterium]|nr:hypothetical protein [Opitutales bacterium]